MEPDVACSDGAESADGQRVHCDRRKAFGVEPKYRVLSRPLLKVAGFFNSDIRESYEMLYQYDSEYLFDSTKFATSFHFTPTGYEEGIRRCETAYEPTASETKAPLGRVRLEWADSIRPIAVLATSGQNRSKADDREFVNATSGAFAPTADLHPLPDSLKRQ